MSPNCLGETLGGRLVTFVQVSHCMQLIPSIPPVELLSPSAPAMLLQKLVPSALLALACRDPQPLPPNPPGSAANPDGGLSYK